MTTPFALVLGLVMGVVFGFALEKARLFEPRILLGQMRLSNFLMSRVFLSAMATGLISLAFLFGTGLVRLYPKTLLWGADLLGGLLLGAGIALAGACPATLPVQLATGCRKAWATLVGALAGALGFLLLEPVLAPRLLTGGSGPLTLDQVTRLPFSALAVAVAVVCVAALVAMERLRPWSHDLDACDPPPKQDD